MFLVVAILPVGGLVLDWTWRHSVELIGYTPPAYVKVVLDIARWCLGLFLMMMVLNVVYHFGCQIRRRYRFVTPGAIFCVLAWVGLGLGFRWYMDKVASPGYDKTYGAVGGVIILLFLMYLAAIILLVGAEINSETDYAVYPVRRGELDIRPAEKAIALKRGEARRTRKAVEERGE
jgi:membrane protein